MKEVSLKEPEKELEKEPEKESDKQSEKEDENDSSEDEAPTKSVRLSTRMSNTPSLDNIDLNDDSTTTEPKGWSTEAEKYDGLYY